MGKVQPCLNLSQTRSGLAVPLWPYFSDVRYRA